MRLVRDTCEVWERLGCRWQQIATHLDAPTPTIWPTSRLNEMTAGRGKDAATVVLDVDGDTADSHDLPGESTCSCCLLVYHRSRLAEHSDGQQVCTDCV